VHSRAGRWSAAARTARTAKRAFYQPFFDDRVVATARRAPIEHRLDEQLIHAMLRHLAPDLVDVPFAGYRWRFDEDGPGDTTERAAWEARAPVRTTSESAAFNWRLNYGADVQAVFAEQVLGEGPGAKLFEILKRKDVEQLLRRYPMGGYHLCWRIFTTSVLLSNTWFNPDTARTPTVQIELPPSNDASAPR
jgi:hypothetical protein